MMNNKQKEQKQKGTKTMMNNKRIAKEIMLIARRISAYDDAKAALDFTAITEARKKFEDQYKSIYDQIKTFDSVVKDIKEKQKALEKELKTNFKVFDKETGVSELIKSAAESLAESMKIGKNMQSVISVLDGIQQGAVSAEKSIQPSYKAAFEILVSMLNGTEYEKYVVAVEGSLKKNIVKIETTNKLFDATAKSFDADFEAIYNERKKEWDERHPEKPLPELDKIKASTNTVRVAGIMSWFGDFTGWVAKKYKAVVNACSDLIKNLFSMQKDAERANSKLEELLKAAKKVKA